MRNLAWLALLLLGLTTQTASAASKSRWYRAESPHFRLLSHSTEATARQKVEELERLHQAMLLTLGAQETLVRPPFPIVMSDDVVMIIRAAPHLAARRAAGYFTSGVDGSQAFVHHNPEASRRFNSHVLFHEYAHRVMAQYSRISYPVWYQEGFAEYFGASVITKDAVEIGSGNSRGALLYDIPWLEPAQLLKPGFHSTGQKGIDTSRFDAFYAQSWLLTHYMLSKTERVQRFNEYFRRISAGEDPVEALEPATGIAPDKLNSELRRHLDNLYAVSIPANAMTHVAARVTEVQAPEAEAEFHAMVIASRPDVRYGNIVLQRLRDAVTQAGGERAPETMRWALAYAELRYGESDKALQLLAPWARQEAPPFEANRLLGLAWQAEAGRVAEDAAARNEAMNQARGFLMAAYKQRRNDASTLHHLALVLSARGTSPSMVNAADAASVLEPQVAAYAYLAVWAHLQAGQPDKAQRGLQSLASNPHGGEGVEHARAALQALRSNQESATVLDLLHGRKKPTTTPP